MPFEIRVSHTERKVIGKHNVAHTIFANYVDKYRGLRNTCFYTELPPVPGKLYKKFHKGLPPPRAPIAPAEIDEYNDLQRLGSSCDTLLDIMQKGLGELEYEIDQVHRHAGHHIYRWEYSLFFMRRDRVNFQEEILHIKEQIRRIEYALSKYASTAPIF